MRTKKICAVLLAALMVFALAACNAPETLRTVYQIYTRANEAMKSVDSLLMDISVDMRMEVMGQSMDVTMTGTAAEVIRSETDIDMRMEMSTSVFGQELGITAYFKDGVYYMDSMGQKVKMAMSVADMMKQSNTEAFMFPESAVKESSVTDKDGGKEISFSLDGAALDDMLMQQMAGMDALLDLGADLSIGDVSLRAVVDKDERLQSMVLAYTLEMGIEGQTANADCRISLTVVQYGGVTVEFPDDLDTYEEGSI